MKENTPLVEDAITFWQGQIQKIIETDCELLGGMTEKLRILDIMSEKLSACRELLRKAA